MSVLMTLGEGWTPDLRHECAYRCANKFGDPPCWALAGDTATGKTTVITPCNECIRKSKEVGSD